LHHNYSFKEYFNLFKLHVNLGGKHIKTGLNILHLKLVLILLEILSKIHW